MSEDDKNQRLNLFSNIWKEITDVIEKNRELNLGSIDYFLNNIDQILEQNGGDWGKASVEYKLIDSLVKRGDLEKYFKKEYSKDENEWKHVDYRNYFKSKENKAGKWNFNLVAANNRVIASSQSYADKSSMNKGIKSVMTNAPKLVIN